MKDPIERQAAIDAVDFGITFAKVIDKSTGDVKELFQEGNRSLTEAIERIKNLPTAEPEQRWIPCSERLPKKNCRCLTTNTAWGAFEVDFNVWINGEWLYPNEKPIAWMPLPEPYREEKQNG